MGLVKRVVLLTILIGSLWLTACAAEKPEALDSHPVAGTESQVSGSGFGIRFDTVFSQMFPDMIYRVADGNSIVNNNEENYYLERVYWGDFTGRGKEFLVVVKRPKSELAHAAGFYNAYAAVFNGANSDILTSVQQFTADEGDIRIFHGDKQDYLFFSGNVTFQGWSEWNGGLFKAAAAGWEKIWPTEEGFWENQAIQAGGDRLIIYRRETKPSQGVIPQSRFVYDRELFWHPDEEKFRENPIE
ncbi:hypothetical protein MFMK1_000564 [Metallumcola ferriviriculae]|uniref:Uncharacterized protein n=1 Tax=Metallumcola ferriviriculae TaxID=3039180 RepID=A0AAU0UKT5_9FIRM|nr:hypothetical protein MFMK1_000564 [Desulfitibacteraceae bacterium MK1]